MNKKDMESLGQKKFIEAKRLSCIIAQLFNGMKVEDTVGITALSLLLNTTIKAQMETEIEKETDGECTRSMLDVIFKTILLDIGKVDQMDTVYDFLKERMHGVN